ncbi:MAG: hypothetical protein WCK14_03230 [Actinomycetota bacterium]|jgi:hypothetical protein
MTQPPLEFRPSSRRCLWCSTTFEAVYRPGRPRIYCRASCRQRAYERRRGLGVLPPSDRLIMSDTRPSSTLPNRFPGYERGQVWSLFGKAHAMRPAGMSELGERRLTLCGVLARPVIRTFHRTAPDACLTCVRVERVRPSARPVRTSSDLAALRALLDDAAVEVSRAPSRQTKSPQQLLVELLAAA